MGGVSRSASGEPAWTTSTYGSRKQLDGLERPVGQRQVGERQIELAALDETQQLEVVGGFGQRDVHLRPGREEPGHHFGEDPLPDALEDPDAKGSRLALGECGEIGLRSGHARGDRTCVSEKQLAGLGEGDRLRASRPLDQPVADDPLERGDLLADCRLGVAQRRCRLAEGSFARDRFQSQEVPEFNTKPAISSHNRTPS